MTINPLYFPRISSSFYFFAFLGFPLFSTNQAKNVLFFFAGVLIPAKYSVLYFGDLAEFRWMPLACCIQVLSTRR